ncbi:MAG: alkaline phosphatase D family protein [Vicinamibacteria bacterium]|nr:alkaline phosphatase D family protein [Vicinamibacteria bacterium]
MKRRDFLGRASVGAAALGFPAIVRSQNAAPRIVSGVQAGDVSGGRAIIWSRCSQPAEMEVEWATNERFENSTIVGNSYSLKSTGLCAKTDLERLPSGETIFYRVRFRDLADARLFGEPASGRFKTPPADERDVSFIWGADTVGQGYGINASMGGLKIYDTMARVEADLFIHVGDTVYSDQPVEKEMRAGDGTIFRNLVTEAKSKVAETLDEFRGQWEYNLIDDNFRRFNSKNAQFVLWDDHEVRNNWYPGQLLEDPRYRTESRVDVLASRARRAFFEFTPIRGIEPTTSKIDRILPYGPLLDVFGLDMRSYRSHNGSNREPKVNADSALLGPIQLATLKRSLKSSRALWKVIACDMPIGLVVGDGPGRYEAVANDDPDGPSGRELEIADLLSFIKKERISNIIWITGDVHYAAAHRYSPEDASFTDFNPFWEFVAGPLHAGTFGPNPLDRTFGPSVRYLSIPKGMKPNQPPSAGLQFFGKGAIDGRTRELTVSLYDLSGKKLWSISLPSIEA